MENLTRTTDKTLAINNNLSGDRSFVSSKFELNSRQIISYLFYRAAIMAIFKRIEVYV